MPESDADPVALIIKQLEKDGPLRDMRPPNAPLQLPTYLTTEVQRSIDRVRMLQMFKLRSGVKTVTAAYYRKLGKELREVAFTDEQREAARQLEAVHQFPPEGVPAKMQFEEETLRPFRRDTSPALKYWCAAEAFYLMMFSAKPPTGYEDGPFRLITTLLYQAVTGEPCDCTAMKHACDFVLKDRKQHNPHAFER